MKLKFPQLSARIIHYLAEIAAKISIPDSDI